MGKVLPLSEGELQLLKSLVSHRVRFMVVGLSAAALQGAPVVTEDVDLWFEDLNAGNFLQALRDVGAGYVPPFGNNPPMLAGRHSEPFDVVLTMDGLGTFADEFKLGCDIRVGTVRLKVLSLERILLSKTAANRPKDKLVLAVLKSTLHAAERARARRTKKARAIPKRHRGPIDKSS